MIPIEDGSMLQPLTTTEQERRDYAESLIERGLEKADEGFSIMVTERLWRNTHRTFAEYCEDLKRVKGWSRKVKRLAAAAALKETPEMSDRQIATVSGVSDPTVGTIRREMERDGELLKVSSSTGADGKVRPRQRAEPEPSPPAPTQISGDRKSVRIRLTWDFNAVADQIVNHYTRGELTMLVARIKGKAELP